MYVGKEEAKLTYMTLGPTNPTLKYNGSMVGDSFNANANKVHHVGISQFLTLKGQFDTTPMIGENRQLVTNEPVEFEK